MGSDCISSWSLLIFLLYTSINIRKIKFIAYIYIDFNQNVDEKSDISAKMEGGKHLHAVCLLTAEQRQ